MRRLCLLCLCWMGCSTEIPQDKSDDTLDTSGDETEVEETPLPEDSIEHYKNVYCSEYADRCDIYPTIEACETEFDSWFDADCTIVDKGTFDVCVDWLLSLDCATEGWIDECDQFYSCP